MPRTPLSAESKAFGERLRELRTTRGLTQEQIAERAGLDRTYVGSVERGERNVALKNAYRLARALEVEVRELFRPSFATSGTTAHAETFQA